MAEGKRGSGRIARSTKVGGVAAGHAARTLRTKTANLGRSDDAAQEALGRDALATADRLVTVLGTMKGAAMKLGQTFSVIDVGMVPEDQREAFQAKLAKLQASAEAACLQGHPQGRRAGPRREARVGVRRLLGGAVGCRLDRAGPPRHAARRARSGGEGPVPGHQRRGPRSDLQNLGLALKLLARISPGLDTKEIATEVRERITEELDYELEASNHRAVARAYRGHPFVVVPDVITDLCRERVIVTEYVEGRRFEEIEGLPEAERSRFGEILARFYVNGPMRNRLLNGDPHPGNSLFLADGRVAFLDFGFFKKLSDEEAQTQREVLIAVHQWDMDQLFEIMRRQGVVTGRNQSDLDQIMSLYSHLCGWLLEDAEVTISPDIVTQAIIEQGKMSRSEVKLPADQIVAARAYVLVLSVLGKLGATNNWSRIAREAMYGDAPQTDLGRAEADWLGVAA